MDRDERIAALEDGLQMALAGLQCARAENAALSAALGVECKINAALWRRIGWREGEGCNPYCPAVVFGCYDDCPAALRAWASSQPRTTAPAPDNGPDDDRKKGA